MVSHQLLRLEVFGLGRFHSSKLRAYSADPTSTFTGGLARSLSRRISSTHTFARVTTAYYRLATRLAFERRRPSYQVVLLTSDVQGHPLYCKQ